jgi:hypothetical protein
MAPEVGFQSDTGDLFRVYLDAYCTSWMVLSIPKIDFLRIQVHSLPGIGENSRRSAASGAPSASFGE